MTDPEDPLDLDAKIARYGWAVTGVISDLPEAPHWLYTSATRRPGCPNSSSSAKPPQSGRAY